MLVSVICYYRNVCEISLSSHLYVSFVNISVYLVIDLPNRLIFILKYCNSFIFVDVNVNIENAMHSDLVIRNNIINYVYLVL